MSAETGTVIASDTWADDGYNVRSLMMPHQIFMSFKL